MTSKYDLDNPHRYGKHLNPFYQNPNDLIHISSAEIERQAKECMEIMKASGDKWTLENQRVNREIDRQAGK